MRGAPPFSARVRAWPAMVMVAGLFALAPAACAPDEAPRGLRGGGKHPGGPTVVFDLAGVSPRAVRERRPVVPFPNDVLTRPDLTSRTGRRLNFQVLARTAIERKSLAEFSRLEGFGTFAPISIPFDRPLDLVDLKKRHRDDDYDFKDDAVYLVNLSTGVPVPLDVGQGNFPLTIPKLDSRRAPPRDSQRAPARDRPGAEGPGAGESNLVFETREEDRNGNGVLDPGEDDDFDGVLDHPNFPGGVRPENGTDGLLTHYESETNTLILRPLVPLDEATEYAVVVTDRLTGVDPAHTPVQSPFDDVHHVAQRASAQKAAEWMSRKVSYYGSFEGSLDVMQHVQFVFTFTTQPTVADLFAMRDGVYGAGKLAWLSREFPARIALVPAVSPASAADGSGDKNDDGNGSGPNDGPPSACAAQGGTHRSIAAITPGTKAILGALATGPLGLSAPAASQLVRSYDEVAYIAGGSMQVPWLLGDVADVSPDRSIDLDLATGAIPHSVAELSFLAVVPRSTPSHRPPFSVALFGHGYGGSALEGLAFAGELARHGIATVAINAPGHGLEQGTGLDPSLFADACLSPFRAALDTTRVRDLDHDGSLVGESGGDFWSAYLFHTRDMVRQAVVEQIMLVKAFKAFDGQLAYDWSGTGEPLMAGDFDRDGAVDFGGPTAHYFAWGTSLGGVLSAVHGGVDPALTATSPVSGGGALSDIGARSSRPGVVEAVQMRLLTPLIASVPPFSVNGDPDLATACTADQRSIRFFGVAGNALRATEIGCAGEGELAEGMDVVVENLATHALRCGRVGAPSGATPTGPGGELLAPQFQVPIPASQGDPLHISVWKPPPGKTQAIRSYGDDCRVDPDAVLTREFSTLPAGAPLVALTEGYGLRRQTPAFRAFLELAQVALEPADPINFAPFYYLKPRHTPTGEPARSTGVLTISTVGDTEVPISASIAVARAHGAIPFLRPANVAAPDYPDYVAPKALMDLYGPKTARTPNQILIDDHVIDGIARYGRHPAGAQCAPNNDPTRDGCPGPPPADYRTVCDQALFDPENLSEGGVPFHPQTPAVPLRLSRLAAPANAAELESTWSPRIATPWVPGPVLGAALHPYVLPLGAHGFSPPDPCKQWDEGTYLLNVIGRFFATEGADLSYLSHPTSAGSSAATDHRCAASNDPAGACPWFTAP